MFRQRVKEVKVEKDSGYFSDEGYTNFRDGRSLTAKEQHNIDSLNQYLENRLEENKPTWSEKRDNWKVENHFREQLTQTPEHQLESVRASHKQFWEDLRVDRDAYIQLRAGVADASSNIGGPQWAGVILNRRTQEIQSGNLPGVKVPNIDPQASPRFASLSCSGMKHAKEQVLSVKQEKEQVSIVEQALPMVRKESTQADGLVLVGVCAAVGIGLGVKNVSSYFQNRGGKKVQPKTTYSLNEYCLDLFWEDCLSINKSVKRKQKRIVKQVFPSRT